MGDLKVSEAFKLPVESKCEIDYCGDYHHNLYDGCGDLLLPCVPEDVDCDAIANAINNHDRLVEENEQLKADYKKEFNDSEDLRCVIEDLKADKAELLELLKDSNEAFRVNLSKFYFKNEAVMYDAHQANAKALQKHKG